jgi:hypothetical protein
MTGPAAAWTATRPTTSPPTSRVPPGNPRGQEHLHRLPATAARRKLTTVGGHRPQPQHEREPPFGTPPIVRRCGAAAFQNRVFGTRCDAGARAVRVWRSSSCRASNASLAASTSRASGAVELARLWPGQVSGPRRPGWGRRSRLRRRPRRSWRCAMSSGARRGLLYQAIGEKETQGGRS